MTALWAILSYCASSILMTITNKFVLSSYKFHMNFFLLMCQSTVCVLMIQISSQLGLVRHRPLTVSDSKNWFVVSLALVAMIFTGSKALQYMSIPLFTVFKNLTIILIAYGEKKFFNGSNVSGLMLTSFVLMVFSSLIAGYSDIFSGDGLNDEDTNNNNNTIDGGGDDDIQEEDGVFMSYLWMISNCLATAFYALIMRSRIKSVGFRDFDTVFYNNFLSVPVLVIASFLTETSEFHRLVDKYSNPDHSSELFGLIVAISISSISSFAISYGSSWCVRVTSSTTYSMVGALNKLPISVFGMLLFDDAITFGGVSGVLIAFTAGVLYSYSKSLQNQPQTGHIPLPLHKNSSSHKLGGSSPLSPREPTNRDVLYSYQTEDLKEAKD